MESSGMGLSNMRARVASLGGVLTISSTPDEGTTVQISLPLVR
jgi:signal transduction histidine kinase